MASIQEQIENARTMEDIVNLLTILFTNLNNQNEMYYDMFLNPQEMYLDLERYDENGQLVTVQLPNVAMMRRIAYSGEGNPNGVLAASVGALYVDNSTSNLYYKSVGSDSYGWILLWSQNNLQKDINYLTPDGSAAQLTDLNMNEAKSGVLSVKYGGTGASNLSGIIKGNGQNAFEGATAGVDYLAPSEFLGMIMYCPIETIPNRWLICDGTEYNISQNPELTNLCGKLGNKYGGDGVTTFKVPNLIDKYIKGGMPVDVGTSGEAQVGSHVHTGTTSETGSHRHGLSKQAAGGVAGTGGTYGNVRIRGGVQVKSSETETFWAAEQLTFSGPFKSAGSKTLSYGNGSSSGQTDVRGFLFDTDYGGWSGAMTYEGQHKHTFTTAESDPVTNDVDHVVMVPIIRY